MERKRMAKAGAYFEEGEQCLASGRSVEGIVLNYLLE